MLIHMEKDSKNGDNFAKLLEEICKVEGDFIIRFVFYILEILLMML